jgi:hypothetical protein
MNQPIVLSEVFNVLGAVSGVQNVENVSLVNKAGTALGYSQYSYDFDSALINNILYPSMDVSIFEVKYPDQDIVGKIVKY